MKRTSSWGFTLIELLTVIAIIGILAGMVFTVGPRAIERAKLARLDNTFNGIRTSSVAYFTKYRDTFPPAYGYKLNKQTTGNDLTDFCLKPYPAFLDFFRDFDQYEEFGDESHDTDRDNELSYLEFSPVGTKSGPNSYEFPTTRYLGNNLSNEVSKQLNEQRPLVYVPVNRKQAKKVAEYFWGNYAFNPSPDWRAERWTNNQGIPTSEAILGNNPFPPNRYDDYVLISVGPGGSTYGLVTPPASFMNDLADEDPADLYHILALRTYFLATRDIDGSSMEGDGNPDFDYLARTRNDQADPGMYSQSGMNLLPDGSNGYGPRIYIPKI